ncbi:MAG: glycoside hydrolase family 172 protein [Thermoguttaceae bacterium]
MRITLTVLIVALGIIRPAPAEQAGPWVLGMAEMHRLDLLPQLRRSVFTGSVSSYDRTGGNDDGFSGKYSFVAKEDDGLVIADLEGPGVVYRIWTPTPSDDLVEFYFDGEKSPRIAVKFRELFLGRQRPFVAPLAGYGAGGFYSYVPLPFEKSCRIKVRAERVQFYQINYARYPQEAPVKTWSPDATDEDRRHEEAAVALWASPGSDISNRVVAEGISTQTVRTSVSLRPGTSATLFETEQGGRIAALRITPASALSGKDRDLVLKVSWDGESKPAVVCPAGDFFGYAWGKPAMTSLLVGTSGETAYCYFPMPFDRSAKIELVSQRSQGPPVEAQAEVVFTPLPRSSGEGRFYATWRRENPTAKGLPFTFLQADGRGHVVGCILQAQGMVSGNTYFFEGDDRTTIDGELAVHGTGSEDFFNGGWYDVPGRWETRLSFPVSGCLGYQKHLGRTGGYRLMVGDAYAFNLSILQTIEHAGTDNSLETDYCAVSYVYLAESPNWSAELPPMAKRGVVDLDQIVFVPSWYVPIHAFTFRNASLGKKDEEIDGQKVSFLSMQAQGDDWFGSPFLSLVCDVPAAGCYQVSIEAVHGPSQGIVQWFERETPVGQAADLYAPRRLRGQRTVLGSTVFSEGPVNLMFKVIGKNEKSEGLGFDLVTIHLDRVK